MLRFFSIAVLVLCSGSVFASYKIHGRVNLGDEWQPKIYLAIVEELSDYYRASPDLIVNTGLVGADGSFVIEGNELPDSPYFYRLYLMKEQNTEFDACLYVGGDDHNFIHIILDNNAALEIQADSTYYAPFGNYQIKGSKENHLMRELTEMVYPSFYFYQIKFPTELRLSEEKLFNGLMQFADTCSTDLVALAAVNNTDMDRYFEQYGPFYQSFGARLKRSNPQLEYTPNYLRKLRFYEGDAGGFPVWAKILLVLQSIVILLMGYLLIKKQKAKEKPTAASPSKPIPSDVLTNKELEILQLIAAGKSNKEIASALFIELSTVKTHINKIYTKLKVKNRKDAIHAVQRGV